MQTSEEHHYNVDINWKNGRIGSMSSPELEQKLDVATPPEFPGGVEGIWSPEHLFVASVSSCFMTSFTAISEYSKFEFESLKVNSSGVMSREDGKYVMSKVILKPVLEITDEKYEKKAYRLLEKAEEICLISRSIKSEIEFHPEVRVLVKE
ncbi:MAG: OsmC family peroxiredoxin [Balneolaceae bacterium]|nr:MAG: OsmC family peroxiredoxin [Balneolaceae bacterium]